MVRRGPRFESARGLRFIPANQLLSSSVEATENEAQRPPASTEQRAREAATVFLIGFRGVRVDVHAASTALGSWVADLNARLGLPPGLAAIGRRFESVRGL